MTELANVEHGSSLALTTEQAFWNDHQLAALRQMGVDNASNGDLAVFLHVAQRTGLDPFARQIHMVGRNAKENGQWVTKWTIQTGIDGLRLVADRADQRDGNLREYEDTLWRDREGNWTDAWDSLTPPVAAKVVVVRAGKRFPATVMYREFVQLKRDGEPNAMWARMPANQLAKCAEAAALRKAYPHDLSGIYIDDEMGQADGPRFVDHSPQRGGLGAVLNRDPSPAPDVVATSEAHSDGSSSADSSATVLGNGDGPSAGEAPGITDAQLRKMGALMRERGITERADALVYVESIIGRAVASRNELTRGEASAVIDALGQPWPGEPVDAEIVEEVAP